MRSIRAVGMAVTVAATTGLAQMPAAAQQVQPRDLGIVEAPTAGSISIPLTELPLPIRHSAEVAFKVYTDGATLTSAQVDKDDVLGIYEVSGTTAEGRLVEADIRPDGKVEELELEVGQGQVPDAVRAALAQYAPGFTPSGDRPRIEKSIRPSDIGLSEIWYEFSGTTFDVEIRSDGRAVLIEPA